MLAHKDAEARGLGPQTQLLLHCFGHGGRHVTGNMKCGTLGNPVGRKEAFHERLLLGIFVLSNAVGTLEKIQALASARLGFEFQPCHLLEPWENDLTSWFFKIIVFGPTSSS